MSAVTPEEVDAAGAEAQALCDRIGEQLEGQEPGIGLAALFGLLRHVGEQVDQPVRELVCRDLRELADELQALDATKH